MNKILHLTTSCKSYYKIVPDRAVPQNFNNTGKKASNIMH